MSDGFQPAQVAGPQPDHSAEPAPLTEEQQRHALAVELVGDALLAIEHIAQVVPAAGGLVGHIRQMKAKLARFAALL